MNLQPINPRPKPRTLYVVCSRCYGRPDASEAYADLDAKPGTYYCRACVGEQPGTSHLRPNKPA